MVPCLLNRARTIKSPSIFKLIISALHANLIKLVLVFSFEIRFIFFFQPTYLTLGARLKTHEHPIYPISNRDQRKLAFDTFMASFQICVSAACDLSRTVLWTFSSVGSSWNSLMSSMWNLIWSDQRCALKYSIYKSLFIILIHYIDTSQ